jgi:hypothetical protein
MHKSEHGEIANGQLIIYMVADICSWSCAVWNLTWRYLFFFPHTLAYLFMAGTRASYVTGSKGRWRSMYVCVVWSVRGSPSPVWSQFIGASTYEITGGRRLAVAVGSFSPLSDNEVVDDDDSICCLVSLTEEDCWVMVVVCCASSTTQCITFCLVTLWYQCIYSFRCSTESS